MYAGAIPYLAQPDFVGMDFPDHDNRPTTSGRRSPSLYYGYVSEEDLSRPTSIYFSPAREPVRQERKSDVVSLVKEKEEKEKEATAEEYPSGIKFICVLAALILSCFLMSIDMVSRSTYITSHHKS